MSHTPGPWHVMEDGFSRKGLWSAPTVYACDDELRYVAVCACADELNFHSATDNIANARLIAAAPDLLEAACSALNMIEQDESAHGRTYGAGNLLRAAIAKATGATDVGQTQT